MVFGNGALAIPYPVLFDRNPELWEYGYMKTTLDLPDDLMREIKILAAREGRKLKDVIADSLRRDLRIGSTDSRPSLRDLSPVSVGTLREPDDSDDRLGDMLNDRGHRY